MRLRKISASAILLAACVTAVSQQPRAAVAPSANVGRPPQVYPAQLPAAGDAAAAAPVLITVIDTSGTVRRELATLKEVARALLAAAPDNSRFGVVTVDSDSEKSLFARREEAAAYIETLTAARGGYTDLNRATDSALALVQREGAGRPVVIAYLTDGKLEVPRTFRDRSDFVSVLRREFTPRPDLRVIVINVNGGVAPQGAETLPPNVNVIPLKDWSAALAAVTGTLAPQIGRQLSPPAAAPPPAAPPPDESWSARTWVVACGIVVALMAAAGYALARRRRRALAGAGADAARADAPENLLSEADMKQARAPEPEPLAVIEAEAGESGARRQFRMEIGERVVLGRTAIAADVVLPGLGQTQTLELRFEKEDGAPALKAYRLRPDALGQLDPVTFNGQPAPPIFTLGHRDRLSVGEWALQLTFTDRKYLPLLGGDDRGVGRALTEEAPEAAPPAAGAGAGHPPVLDATTLFRPENYVPLRRRGGSARHPS